jgi:hypothetical protein
MMYRHSLVWKIMLVSYSRVEISSDVGGGGVIMKPFTQRWDEISM